MSSLHEDLGVRGRFPQETVDLSRHTLDRRDVENENTALLAARHIK